MKLWALLLAAASAAAQQPSLDDQKQAAQKDCGSVVIVKCELPAPAIGASAAEPALQQPRLFSARRQTTGVQALDGVVIEGEALRRRSVEETMAGAFPTVRARDGSHTFDSGDGSKCTCLNVCPPWPFPCCTCSAVMSRYRSMPGSSPLN